MPYRSERFDPGELSGLQTAWSVVDAFESSGHMTVVNEILAGTSYRRQLHPDTQADIGDVNYLLQVTLEPTVRDDGLRVTARDYLDGSKKLLTAIEMPGTTNIDEGGLDGYDPSTTDMPFGTGRTETDILRIYPPWLEASWEEAGKSCLLYCGILPPQPKGFMEDHMHHWTERDMRKGRVVFSRTPVGLETV
jgi:hypothetical protein